MVMELHYFYIFFTILLSCLFPQPLNCQQAFLNDTVYNCSDNFDGARAYLCNGPQKSCTSFLVFKSKPPSDSPESIANLSGSDASSIASINKISNNDKIPTNKSIIVPVSCSCSGGIYQHSAPYSIKQNDTIFMMVSRPYQGLTSCQTVLSQNYYIPTNLSIGDEFTVPVLCACPTANQMARGVTSLLVYSVSQGDTVKSIGEAYGVDEQSMLDANELSKTPNLIAETPILVPLRGKSCKEDPNSFYCTCSQGLDANATFKGPPLHCDESDGRKFPAKLVASLGTFCLSP